MKTVLALNEDNCAMNYIEKQLVLLLIFFKKRRGGFVHVNS